MAGPTRLGKQRASGLPRYGPGRQPIVPVRQPTASTRPRTALPPPRIASRAERSCDTLSSTGSPAPMAGLGRIALEHEINRAPPLVLAFLDVDGLKQVNGRRGHAAGDALLRGVVDAIETHLRSYDPIVRIGGDEFICALADCTLDEARLRFKKIAQRSMSDLNRFRCCVVLTSQMSPRRNRRFGPVTRTSPDGCDTPGRNLRLVASEVVVPADRSTA